LRYLSYGYLTGVLQFGATMKTDRKLIKVDSLGKDIFVSAVVDKKLYGLSSWPDFPNEF
jgi:hypothetical protein